MSRTAVRWLCLVLLLVPVATSALDAKKTAAALAARAAKAYEAGNMTQAAGLYRDAAHIDASEPAYLYGAARAAQTGHDLVHAEQDYLAFLARKDADAGRVAKAKGFLAQVHAELSVQKAGEAQQAAASGDNVLAISLYLEASRMAPDQPEPLLKAALLERKQADKKAAIEHLRKYLQLAPPTATGRGTAESLLVELTKPAASDLVEEPRKPEPVVAPKPEPVVAKPEPVVTKPEPFVAKPQQVVAAKPEPSMSTRKVSGWTAIGVGSAAVIAAGILAVVAMGEQSTLDANLLPSGNFDGRKISVADAASAQISVNSKWTGMGIAAGVGLAAIGVGSWLVATDRPTVAVLPSWNGFSLAGRF